MSFPSSSLAPLSPVSSSTSAHSFNQHHIHPEYPQRYFLKNFPLAPTFAEFHSLYSQQDIEDYLAKINENLWLPQDGPINRPTLLSPTVKLTLRSSALNFKAFYHKCMDAYGRGLYFLSRLHYPYLMELLEAYDIVPRLLAPKGLTIIPNKMRIVVELFIFIRSNIARAIDRSIPMVYRFVQSASPADLLYRFIPFFLPFFETSFPREPALYNAYLRELSLLNYLQPDYIDPIDPAVLSCRNLTGTHLLLINQNLQELTKNYNNDFLDPEPLLYLIDSWIPEKIPISNHTVMESNIFFKIQKDTAQAFVSLNEGTLTFNDLIAIIEKWVMVLGTIKKTGYQHNPISAYSKLHINTKNKDNPFGTKTGMTFVTRNPTFSFFAAASSDSQYLNCIIPKVHRPFNKIKYKLRYHKLPHRYDEQLSSHHDDLKDRKHYDGYYRHYYCDKDGNGDIRPYHKF